MSWASHNPELYDELCEKGIARALDSVLGGEFTKEQIATITYLLYQEPKLQDALLAWASGPVAQAIANHWAAQVDAARERGKYGQT